MIKVYTDKDNTEYNEGYLAIIQVREEEESLFWDSDRDVGLYLKTYYDDPQCKLNTYIRLLQRFYLIHTHRRIKFLKGSKRLYNSFLILLEGCTEKLYLPYLMGNLRIVENTTDSLYGFVRKKKEENLEKLTYSQIVPKSKLWSFLKGRKVLFAQPVCSTEAI